MRVNTQFLKQGFTPMLKKKIAFIFSASKFETALNTYIPIFPYCLSNQITN